MNTKSSRNTKSNKGNLLIVIVLFCALVGYLVYSSIGNTMTPDKIQPSTYGEFISSINEKAVTEVNAKETTNNKMILTYKLSGQDGTEYVAEVPNGEEIQMLLQQSATNGEIQKLNFTKDVENPWLGTILSTGFVLIAGIIMFSFFFSKMNKMQGNNAQHTKSRAKLQKNNNITFASVAGYEEEKEELQEIVDFLKYPKKYLEMGARIPKGVLLSGPPGTGKTLLARATAGEANVNFFTISGSDFLELYVGVGASRVRDMFAKAQQSAPAIIFIDEIDAIGRQRGAGVGGGNDEREQTLNQILVEMDGFEQRNAVVVMAATNRADVLDPALLRPGRFDRQVGVNLPDLKTRVAILTLTSKNKPLAEDINFEAIARRTPGFSGAELESVFNEAALLAARINQKQITMVEVEEAIDRVMMGPAKKSKEYTEKERNLVAYHEAGHAVVGLILDDASTVQKITIIPRGQAGGYNLMTPNDEEYFSTKTQLLDQIAGLLGGRVAEEITFGDISSGAYNDIERVTAIARAMVTAYGMSELGPIQYEKQDGSVFLGRDYGKNQNFSEQTAVDIDAVIRKIVETEHQRVTTMLKENTALLKAIADKLLDQETIVREEIEEIAKVFLPKFQNNNN